MNRAQFQAAFAASLEAIAQAEVVTKRELKSLSRTLLTALHGLEDDTLQGDIQYINMLLGVLTPINRKTAVLFFKEFTGFHYDARTKENPGATETFTKKSAKHGPEARKLAIEFLQDPNNNIWSWAERNIEVERRPFDMKKVTKVVEKALDEAGGDQMPVLRAILEGGITVEGVMILLDELTKQREGQAEQLPDAPV